jgi:hypothetical protein
MSNPLKYIKDLEAAGFDRVQAEAQVQMVLDALEGDLVTKSEFATFKEHMDRRFAELAYKLNESELRLIIRLGLVTVSTTTIAVAILTWLIKLK